MPKNLRLKIFLFTLIRTLVNTMHRMVYALLPAFARGVGVDVTTFTRALAARSLLGVASPFIGSISDQRGRKFGMLLGLSVFLLGTSFVILWPTFPALVAAMLLCTTGKYILDPSIYAYLGDQIPYQQRGRAIALIEFGWSLSFILGIPLVGFLIARAGWMAPFPLLAGVTVLAILFVNRQISETASHSQTAEGVTLHKPSFFSGLRDILTYPSAVAALLFGLCMSAANETINIVFSVWLEQSFNLQLTALALAPLVIGISELGGESLVSLITDRMGKARAIAGGLILNSLMVLTLPLIGHTLPGALVGLFLFYITFEFTIVSGIPLMTEIMPGRRATLLAVNVAGFSFGRALAGWLATPVFAWGIFASAIVAVGFNVFALVALRRVRMEDSVRQPEEVAS